MYAAYGGGNINWNGSRWCDLSFQRLWDRGQEPSVPPCNDVILYCSKAVNWLNMHKKATLREDFQKSLSMSVSVLGWRWFFLHMAGEKIIFGLFIRLNVQLVVQTNIPPASHMAASQCIQALFTRKPRLLKPTIFRNALKKCFRLHGDGGKNWKQCSTYVRPGVALQVYSPKAVEGEEEHLEQAVFTEVAAC